MNLNNQRSSIRNLVRKRSHITSEERGREGVCADADVNNLTRNSSGVSDESAERDKNGPKNADVICQCSFNQSIIIILD